MLSTAERTANELWAASLAVLLASLLLRQPQLFVDRAASCCSIAGVSRVWERYCLRGLSYSAFAGPDARVLRRRGAADARDHQRQAAAAGVDRGRGHRARRRHPAAAGARRARRTSPGRRMLSACCCRCAGTSACGATTASAAMRAACTRLARPRCAPATSSALAPQEMEVLGRGLSAGLSHASSRWSSCGLPPANPFGDVAAAAAVAVRRPAADRRRARLSARRQPAPAALEGDGARAGPGAAGEALRADDEPSPAWCC